MVIGMLSPTWPSVPVGRAVRPPSIELGQRPRKASDDGNIWRHHKAALCRSAPQRDSHQLVSVLLRLVPAEETTG